MDLWSAGCVLAELALREPLFPGDGELDTLARIFEARGSPTEQAWPGVSALPWYCQPPPPQLKGGEKSA